MVGLLKGTAGAIFLGGLMGGPALIILFDVLDVLLGIALLGSIGMAGWFSDVLLENKLSPWLVTLEEVLMDVVLFRLSLGIGTGLGGPLLSLIAS